VRILALALFCASALLLAKGAQAEPARAALQLRVERSAEAQAKGCADEAELQRRVAKLMLKAESATVHAIRIDVRFYFVAATRELFAEVSASGPKPGQRTLRDVGPGCDALSGGVAVAIALLLDELEHAEAAEPSSPPSLPVSPPPPAEEPPARLPPAPSRTRTAFRLGAELGGGYGLGGSGTALGSLRAGVRRGALRADVAVSGTWPRTSRFDTGELRTSLWFASARGCWLLGQRLALGPCVQLGVGRLRGEGTGYEEARTANLPWTAAGLGLGAEVPLGDTVRATFGATLWLPFERQTFSVQNRGTAWESARAAGILSAGIELSTL
jgi:hypothetical protein